ncbi:MAG: BON domain-containing protein [Acidobacteria bacterium]|nr:BON domain-containing protein [Acidobacteriota bacterium]
MKSKLLPTFILASSLTLFGCTSQEIDDSTLTTTVKSKLLVNADTSALKIGVQTTNGVVTLSGTVPTLTEKTRAEEVASKTDHVKRVINSITIDSESIGATNADEKLGNAIEHIADTTSELVQPVDSTNDQTISNKIKAHLVVAGGVGIEVQVVAGNVILTGEIPNTSEKAKAEAFSRTVEGVKSVQNRLVTKKI